MNKENKKILSLSMIVATIVVVLINTIVILASDTINLRIDVTRNKVFQIDAKSQEILQDFDTPTSLIVLAQEETFTSNSLYNAQANEVFKLFAQKSNAITLQYIDFVSDPSIATKYPNMQLKLGDIVLETENDVYHLPTEDLFNYTYGQRGQLIISSSRAEEALLAGLLSVSSDTKQVISLVSGHAEYDMPEFISLMERNNYEVEFVNLATEPINPLSDIVVMFAPKNDLSLDELSKLDRFLENNGNYNKMLLYTADPSQQVLPNLSIFLREWGVEVLGGSVFETDENRVYNYQPFYGIVDYVDFDFEDMLLSNTVPMLFPLSKPLNVLFESRNNYSTRVLVEFGPTSGVRPDNAPDNFNASMAVDRGPMPALVLAKRSASATANAQASYVVVAGSTAFVDTFALTNSSFSNAEYILNVFEVISESQNFRILPKQIIGSGLNLSKSQSDTIGSLFVFVGPSAMLVLSVFIYLKRKNL